MIPGRAPVTGDGAAQIAVGARGGVGAASGQTPIDPATGALVEGGLDVQSRRVLDSLQQVLDAAGCSVADVVEVDVHATDMADFPAMNALEIRRRKA